MRKIKWNRSISSLMIVLLSLTLLAETGLRAAAKEATAVMALEDAKDELLLTESESSLSQSEQSLSQNEQSLSQNELPAEIKENDPTVTADGSIGVLTKGLPQAAQVQSMELIISDELLLAGAAYTAAEYSLTDNVTVTSSNCTVESILWQDPGGNQLQEGKRLSYRTTYTAIITLKANGSDRFAENATVTVNGSEENVLVVNRYGDGDQPYSKLQLTWSFEPRVKDSINSFFLSSVPSAVPGAKAEPYSYTYTVDSESQYTVTGSWHQYNASTRQYEAMTDSDVFGDGGAYQLVLHTEMKPGYVIHLDPPLDVMVDNRIPTVQSYDEFGWDALLHDSFGIKLWEVSFTLPEPVEGQTFSNEKPIAAQVPSDSHYRVEGNWMEESTGDVAGTFTPGKAYHFIYTLYASDGYYLAENVSTYINGVFTEEISGNGKIGSGKYRRSMKSLIREAVLTNVPTAQVGTPLQMGVFAITVPEGAQYQATGYWHDALQGTPITGDVTEAGKTYDLWIDLKADPGYEFADSYLLRINGAAHQNEGGWDFSSYRIHYSFLEQIHQIEVTGMVEPVMGQTPDTASLRSLEPGKYEITQAYWSDLATGLPATLFEDGHTYELIVEVEAEPGHEFAPNVSWKLGKERGKGAPHTNLLCRLAAEYSFAEVVPKIQIDQVPEVKVGELPQTDLPVPEGANYAAKADWRVWNDSTEIWEPFTGAFQKEMNYYMIISVVSAKGYRLDPQVTTCYLNGVLHKDVEIRTLKALAETIYTTEGAKMIRKVEVSVQKPADGEHSSVDPVITLPHGINYRLRRGGGQWLEGSIEEKVILQDHYFETDGSHGVNFRLLANEGYEFARDLVVVVNGIVLPKEPFSPSLKTLDVDYFFHMTCQHLYDNEADNTCNACGYQRYKDTGSKEEGENGVVPNASRRPGKEISKEMSPANPTNKIGAEVVPKIEKGTEVNRKVKVTVEKPVTGEETDIVNAKEETDIVSSEEETNMVDSKEETDMANSKTGDQSMLLFWIIILVLCGIAVIGIYHNLPQ